MRWTLTTLAFLMLAATRADAGWVTVRNDTDKTVYLQEPREGFLPGLLSRRRRPVRLTPGETFKEFQAEPGEKSLDVFDAAAPAEPVHKAILKWGPTDVTFRLAIEAGLMPGEAKWTFALPKPAPAPTNPVVTVKAEVKK